MAVLQPSKTFFDDIKGQLECPICTDQFKNPKQLPCLHTFCEKCVEQYVKTKGDPFPCPACRLPVHVPAEGVSGFQNNFFVNNLLDTVVFHDTVKNSCAICEEAGRANASAQFLCIECKDYLCNNCKASHSNTRPTRNHTIVSSADMDNERVQVELRSNQQVNCTTHQWEPVRFYCVPCKVPICRDCTIVKHHGHKCEELEEAARRAKVTLNQQLAKLNRTKGVIMLHKERVEKEKKNFSQQAADVQTEMTEWRKKSQTQIQNDRKQQEEDLDCQYEKKQKELDEWHSQGKSDLKQRFTEKEVELDQKQQEVAGDLRTTVVQESKKFDAANDQLSLNLGTLQSTVDTADKIIKHGKPAEILLHQDQVLERIMHLLAEVKPVLLAPSNIRFEGNIGTVHETKLHKSVTISPLTSSASPKYKQKAMIVCTFDSKSQSDKQASCPVGVVVLLTGDACITDYHNNKVKLFTPNGTLKWEIPMHEPWNMAITKDKDIMVTKRKQSVIDVIDCLGKKVRSIDSGVQCVRPGIEARGDMVVLTDSDGKHVYVCDQFLKVAKTIQHESFRCPRNAAISDTKIIISDYHAHCVFIHTHTGDHVATYGTPGQQANGPGKLSYPRGVCTDVYGNILVADSGNRKIHLLNPEGEFIRYLDLEDSPRGVALTPAGNLVVTLKGGLVRIFQYLDQ